MQGILFKDQRVRIDARSVEIGGSWEPPKPKKGIKEVMANDTRLVGFFLDQMLEYENPYVLDVGAGTGSFCLLAKFHLGATILAFEPNPFALPVLHSNIELNEIADRVTVFPYALSNYTGKGQLKLPKKKHKYCLACLGTPLRFDEWTEVSVDVAQLDDLDLPRPIDLMKVDTEGCELNVLNGGEQTILKDKPAILVEYYVPNTAQFGYKPEAIKKLLQSWGYIHFEKIGGQDLWTKF